MPFLQIYPASKTKHFSKWRTIDLTSRYIKIIARWVKQVDIDGGDILKIEREHEYASRCWIEDIEDIQKADYLMLYAEEGEHLRGGLIEAGAAIAFGIPVIIIGKHPDYGTWQYHPNVKQIHSIDHFEAWAKRELDLRMEAIKNRKI